MNIFALLSLFVSVLSTFLGNFIYHLDKKRPLNRVFTLLCLSIAWWAFAEFMYRQAGNPDTAHLWIRASSMWTFSVVLTLHFVLAFTETKLLRNKLTYFLMYIPALILSSIDLTTDLITSGPVKEFWGYTYGIQQGSLLFWVSYIWAFGLAFSAVILCVGHYLRTTDKTKKQQTRYVSIGFFITIFTAFLTEWVFPALEVKFPELTTLSFAVLTIFVGYAVWKYELFTLSPATAIENIISMMPDSLILADSDGKILRTNRSLLNLLGYREDELTGKSMHIFFAEEQIWSKVLGELLNNKICEDYETILKTKANEERYVTFSCTAVRRKEGQIVGIIFIAHDITERKQFEEALVYERDLMQALMDNIPDAIYFKDIASRNTRINRAHAERMGLNDPMEAIGKTDSDFYPEEFARETYADEQKVVKTGQPLVGKIEKITMQDGRTRWVSATKVPIKDREGQVTGLVGVSRDITEHKKMQEDLRRYSEHLEELVEEKTRKLKEAERLAAIGETAAMVGHDLRNPLQAIVGSLYLANEELKSLPCESREKSSVKEHLETISEQVKYMNKIVSDLQDYARPIQPELALTNLHQLIDETLSSVAIPENVQVTITIPEYSNELIIDPLLMKRVFANLVTNALQAMPDGGKLTIKASRTEDIASISVQDTGVGIPEENLPNLFQPLFTTKSKGQGFGLPVCKRIAEAHNGCIIVKSKTGVGSTFTVKIPMRKGGE